MGNLTVFTFEEFADIRVIRDDFDDEPLFCLKDICAVLEIQASDVIKRLDDWVVSIHPTADNLGRLRDTNFINEAGLYEVVASSKKPVGKKLRKFIFSEVLPSIRKTGAYMTPEVIEKTLTDPDYLIQLATEMKKLQQKNQILSNDIQIKENEIKANAPATRIGKDVLNTEGSVPITIIASKWGFSAIRLNKLLQHLGVIRRVGKQWTLCSKYHNNGYEEYKDVLTVGKDGKPHTVQFMRWTMKGREFLRELLLKRGHITEDQ